VQTKSKNLSGRMRLLEIKCIGAEASDNSTEEDSLRLKVASSLAKIRRTWKAQS
jgi:hypothetical protein